MPAMEVPALPPERLADVRRVVLLWIGRLGDFLVATPFLHGLRSRFPEAHIAFVAGEKNAEAAGLCPDIDEVRVLRRFLHPLDNLGLAWRLRTRPAELLIDLNSAHSRASSCLARISRARLKLAFDKRGAAGAFTDRLPGAGESEHMLDRYGRLAGAVGAPYDPTLRFPVRAEDRLRAVELLRGLCPPAEAERTRWIGMHPGNFKKFDNRWPEERFAELAGRLLETGSWRVALLCGPGEQAQAARVASSVKKPVSVIPPLPLGLAAAVLSRLDLLIANATGTAHLAAAVGTPTFSLLSRYTKTVWMPRTGPHQSVVSEHWESCRDIPVETAWASLRRVLEGLRDRRNAGQ